jgi:hypothetical protein
VKNAQQGLAEQGGLAKVLLGDRDQLASNVKQTIASLPKLAGIDVPDFAKRSPLNSLPGGSAGKKGGKEQKDEKLEAFESSSKEALAELARATRGDDAAEKTAANTERIADASERAADALEEDDGGEQPFDLTGGGF